jgi:hypothetical protein
MSLLHERRSPWCYLHAQIGKWNGYWERVQWLFSWNSIAIFWEGTLFPSVCFTLLLVRTTLSHKNKTRKGGRIMELIPCNGVVLGKLPVAQLLMNFPTFYGTRGFVAVFIWALHWFLSWARLIQYILPHPSFLTSIWTLSSHWSIFFWHPYQNHIWIRFLSHAYYTPYPSHLLDRITVIIFGEEHEL